MIWALRMCCLGAAILLARGAGASEHQGQIFPVRYGTVVFQHGLAPVRLVGVPSLTQEPSELDDSYLARQAVAPETLPLWIRAARNGSLTVFLPNGKSCRTRLKAIAAYGWAVPREAWDGLDPAARARRAFDAGTQFIAGDIDNPRCRNGVAATTDVAIEKRFLPAVPASDVFRKAALSEVRRVSSYGAVQESYVKFKAARRNGPARPPLPAEWIDLSGDDQYWTLSKGQTPRLLVAHFSRMAAAGQLVTAPHGTSGMVDFNGLLLVVWRIVDRSKPTLVFAGPEGILDRFDEPVLHGGVSDDGEVPLLLLSANGTFHALSLVDGRYRLDKALTFGPGRP